MFWLLIARMTILLFLRNNVIFSCKNLQNKNIFTTFANDYFSLLFIRRKETTTRRRILAAMLDKEKWRLWKSILILLI